ncbi:MAG: alpha amylase N-terminal ig-like domain-containing protein, partial [Spirochaetales bacterium]|nr:alpha amylase N-terminal ig-like domain-containing protein [Spirochaetales bacterium]
MKNNLILFVIALLLFSCSSTSKKMDLSQEELTKFNASFIYSDGTEFYRSPSEPVINSSFLSRLRVKRSSTTEVNLIIGDKKIEMVKESRDDMFDYFVAEVKTGTDPIYFYYEVKQDKKAVFYSRRGFELKKPINSYMFKVFPGFTIPTWSKGAVLYQIYVDRFNNGDPANDVLTNEYMYDNWPSVKVNNWNRYPDSQTPYSKGGNRTREFFGGDLEGVIQKIDYLKDLGIDGVYFNPLFVSPSNHKYDSQDYDNVDPHLGVIVNDGGELINPELDPNYKNPVTGNPSSVNKDATKYIKRVTDKENLDASNKKLQELISKFHSNNMKVILDGVFNHSGSFNKWLDRENIYPGNEGAYESKDSPFLKYFIFSKDQWPQNESYEAWWGYKTLPKLNFEDSKELENNILNMSANWVGSGFNADGWRLDVAADLGKSASYNHKFWQMFRDKVKGANNESVIYAEVYGDSSGWLNGKEWDSVMNYDAFFEPVSFFLTGLEKHSYYKRDDLLNNSKNFEKDLREKMAKLPYNSLMASMNQLDNHDHSR